MEMPTLDRMVRYARRVAFRMSKDPEMESIAGRAAWRAQRTYNINTGVPLKRWIALIVKRAVWYYWRQLKERCEQQLSDLQWESFAAPEDEAEKYDIPAQDYQLLVRYYVAKWPLDVVARRYGTSRNGARALVAAATARFRRMHATAAE